MTTGKRRAVEVKAVVVGKEILATGLGVITNQMETLLQNEPLQMSFPESQRTSGDPISCCFL